MYSNNILNFQESTTILNACTKKVWKLIEGTTYLSISLRWGIVIIILYTLLTAILIWDCYTHLGCYPHNILSAVLSGLLQLLFVIFGNLPGILNLTLYLNLGLVQDMNRGMRIVDP